MIDLVNEFKTITQDRYLMKLNIELKKILVKTNWGKKNENKNKRLELGNTVLFGLLENIIKKKIQKNSIKPIDINNLKLLKSAIAELSSGYITQKISATDEKNLPTEKLGVTLRKIWDLLEPHMDLARRKYMGLWPVYGVGLNNDFDITDNRYLKEIIASNALKIYYAVVIDDLADNNIFNEPGKNSKAELIFIKKIILPRIFSNKKFYNNKELIKIFKTRNISLKRIKFIMAVYEVVNTFYRIDCCLPYFNAVKKKMLKAFELHLDDCIIANGFNQEPRHISLKKYINTGTYGMLMLSYFYTQMAGRRKKIKPQSIKIKELIVEYMQKAQRIMNDVTTWEREYGEKCYYNSIMISALEKKYIDTNTLKRHNLKEKQIEKIKNDIVSKLPLVAIDFLKKIKNISPLSYSSAAERVIWVGKIQKAFQGQK